ncbi:MAG: hypothetical protein AB1453_05500 [Chloroflexota bacterium]
MRLKRVLLHFVLIILVLSSATGWVNFEPPQPDTAEAPPLAPAGAEPSSAAGGLAQTSPLSLPPLKAVLIVAPIDGEKGAWTLKEITNMELAAEELSRNGVTVHKFYPPNDDWAAIKTAANGAHFLYYRGHGVYWGAMPAPPVGGFALTKTFVSNEEIRANLHLAPNAIVMLYGCFTAGSSSNDSAPISLAEAQRRVSMYSEPFLTAGAGGYYANWFGSAFQLLTRYLFEGNTLGEAYKRLFDFNSATVNYGVHSYHPSLAMWLDKDNWAMAAPPPPQYNYAFAGKPDATLADLFGVGLELERYTITAFVQPGYESQLHEVQVIANTSQPYSWSASLTSLQGGDDWLSLTRLSGLAGEPILLSLAEGQAVGTYEAQITVTGSNPPVIFNNPRQLTVRLFVVEQIHQVYLPAVQR